MPIGIYNHKPLSEETKQKISIAHKGKSMSKETRIKMSNSRKGIVPWNKGKNYSIGVRGGGYHAIHNWIAKYYGRANKCESVTCSQKSKTFQWALLQEKKYEHKRENFWQLCS